jgi:preprotein translocase subunit SecG
MKNIITIVQIAVSVLLIASILLQQQGVGLSSTFGGEGNAFRTKRGLEKGLFYATIVLSAVFLGASLALIIISK